MIRMMDSLYTHKTYQRAARGALRVLLRIAKGETSSNVELILPGSEDNKEKKESEPDVASTPEEDAKLAAMTPAERKKYKSKLRKQNKKKDAAAKDQNNEEDADEEAAKKESFVDPDPLGLKALGTVNALPDALKWCSTLIKFNQLEPDTFALVAETYLLASKYSLALRAISAGFESHSRLHSKLPVNGNILVALVQFSNQWSQYDSSAMNALAREAIVAQLDELLQHNSMVDYVKALIPTSSTIPLEFRVAVARAVSLCKTSSAEFTVSYAAQIVTSDSFCDWNVISAKSCIKAITVSLLFVFIISIH